jgi:hypothetical protein
MNNDSIVDQKHWDIGYENQILSVVSKDDPIRELIVRHIPQSGGGGGVIVLKSVHILVVIWAFLVNWGMN